MKKKNIIVWSIVVGVIVAIGVICTMVFTLSKIDFQLTAQISIPGRSRLFTQGQSVDSVEDHMLNSAEFDKGGNLLFMQFDQQIENIEKNNPYVKVEKIVRRFPNKATVYYSEREAVALLPVQSVNNAYFVVDTDLKILDYVIESNGEFINQALSKFTLPVINYYTYCVDSSHKVGDFVDNISLKEHLQTFVSGAFSANGQAAALYEDIMGFASQANFYLETNEDNRLKYVVKANSNANVTFEIYNTNERLFDKIALSWDLFITQYKETSITSTINLKVYVDQTSHKITIADTQTQEIIDTEK